MADEAINGRQQAVCALPNLYDHVEFLTSNKIFETLHVRVWNAVTVEVGWLIPGVVDRIYNRLTR